MRVMFIEARKRLSRLSPNDNKNIKALNAIPKKARRIGLITTVQYIDLLKPVKEFLIKQGKSVFIAKGSLTRHPGQLLGCDISAAKKLINIDAFLFIGSGMFHAEQIALLGKLVFIWHPEHNSLDKISKKAIAKLKKRKKAALFRFLSADTVGIIVSIKPGQFNLKEALRIKEKLTKKGKEAFIFLTDTINLQELENFSCKAWLNTACQALNMEPKILNLADAIDIL